MIVTARCVTRPESEIGAAVSLLLSLFLSLFLVSASLSPPFREGGVSLSQDDSAIKMISDQIENKMKFEDCNC